MKEDKNKENPNRKTYKKFINNLLRGMNRADSLDGTEKKEHDKYGRS